MARAGRGQPPGPAVAPEDPPIALSELMLLVGLALLVVGIAWNVPTPHELPRPDYHHRYEPKDDGEGRASPARPSNTVATLGPLEVGDALADWRIEAIELGAHDARILVVHGGVEATLGFSGPAGDAPNGPYSQGDLHIYFSGTLAPGSLDSVGLALRDRLAEGRPQPGAAVDAWIASARAILPSRELPSPF